MRHIIFCGILLLGSTLVGRGWACESGAHPDKGGSHALISTAEAATTTPATAANAGAATLALTIDGMRCAMCSAAIAKKVKAVPGVSACAVDHAKGTGTVTYDAAKANPQAILDAVKAAGFTATVAP